MVMDDVARTGRDKQIYTSDGAREVVGVVAIIKESKQIVLVSSRKHEKYVLPKGGAENDETFEESAIRECWEEAGCSKGTITKFLASYGPDDEVTLLAKRKSKTRFTFFEMDVTSLEDKWPECKERTRKLASYDEALEILKDPVFLAALNLCSLAPT
ncbi:hypothetical protein SmJEL517_g05082 [Synchytrium microbalum]|uniref:Nudix hydrolase domain-containing protein n=1 Tax=Synchytrium microbalum TaxID=1806994 RepID=A0A507BR89_9FUNG|nr:uncharacterized protein SmJEL517_g05082 [Synchytrium microbalum]TPX31667.1 hypothetical protein SmJEL517_g05082 [Synchytrium microbalum]